ncbi:MAG: hypothetical protein PHQ98_02500 [Candidatus ainarchaeum sp.]|nr:hypothetical protein [Candidatus ainarchaeum sp.]
MKQIKFNQKHTLTKIFGQGTIEYLVILSIVLILALIGVILLPNLINNQDTNKKAKEAGLILNPITVTDNLLTKDGNYLISIKNNSTNMILIKSIKINDQNTDLNQNNLLEISQERLFLTNTLPCNINDSIQNEIIIEYESIEGIKHSEEFTIKNSCFDYNIL